MSKTGGTLSQFLNTTADKTMWTLWSISRFSDTFPHFPKFQLYLTANPSPLWVNVEDEVRRVASANFGLNNMRNEPPFPENNFQTTFCKTRLNTLSIPMLPTSSLGDTQCCGSVKMPMRQHWQKGKGVDVQLGLQNVVFLSGTPQNWYFQPPFVLK